MREFEGTSVPSFFCRVVKFHVPLVCMKTIQKETAMQAANENFEPEIDLAKLPGVKAAEEFKPLDTMATLEHQAL